MGKSDHLGIYVSPTKKEYKEKERKGANLNGIPVKSQKGLST